MENRAPYARKHNKDLGGPNFLSRNDPFSATENTCSVFLFAGFMNAEPAVGWFYQAKLRTAAGAHT